jgi:D-3-phosphoglycerate dehydrogenase
VPQSKRKLVLCDTIFSPQLEQLARDGLRAWNLEIVNLWRAPKDHKELGELLSDADAVACDPVTEIAADVIDKMKNCKIVVTLSTGYDHIALEAASKKGIYVCCVPNYCVEEVADHALALLLAVSRKIQRLHNNIELGKWEDYQGVGPVHRLRGRTLGLIGVGKIGKSVAERAKAFGLRVVAFDPYVPAASLPDITLMGLDDVLHNADIISIHSALTNETRGMISSKQFKEMKDGVFIINCARGAVIDAKALVEAIRNGKVEGAGLDVFEKEPPNPDEELLHMDEVFVTPHTAYVSVEADYDRQQIPVEEIDRAWKGEKPKGAVNLVMLEKLGRGPEKLVPAS